MLPRAMRRPLFVLLACLPILLVIACKRDPAPVMGAVGGYTPGPVAFSYVSGSDGGTVVVPVDTFVTSIWSGEGTFTITPSSQYTYPACDAGYTDGGNSDGGYTDAGCTANDAALADGGTNADAGTTCAVTWSTTWTNNWVPCIATGTTITVPAAGYFLGEPTLQGSARELADGTVIVFAAGTSYAVTMNRYGP